MSKTTQYNRRSPITDALHGAAGASATLARGRGAQRRHLCPLCRDFGGPGNRSCRNSGPRTDPPPRRCVFASGRVHVARAGGDPRDLSSEAGRPLRPEAGAVERLDHRARTRHVDGEACLRSGDGRCRQRRSVQLRGRPSHRRSHSWRGSRQCAGRPSLHRRYRHRRSTPRRARAARGHLAGIGAAARPRDQRAAARESHDPLHTRLGTANAGRERRRAGAYIIRN